MTRTITDDDFDWIRDDLTLTLHGHGWNTTAITTVTTAVDGLRDQIVGTPA